MKKIKDKWCCIVKNSTDFRRAIAFLQGCGYDIGNNTAKSDGMEEWEMLVQNEFFDSKGTMIIRRAKVSWLSESSSVIDKLILFGNVDALIKHHMEQV